MTDYSHKLLVAVGALAFAALGVGVCADELSVTPGTLTRAGALALSGDGSTYVFKATSQEGAGFVLSDAQSSDQQTSVPDSYKNTVNRHVSFVAISADGTSIVANFGQTITGGGIQADDGFRWTLASEWTALNFTATGASADGTVIVGFRERGESQQYRWRAVVSRNGGAAVALPQADGSKINGRVVKVSGDGRVIVGTLNREDYDPKNLLLRWVDDVGSPLLPLTGCYPRLVSPDGYRVFYSDTNGRCFVLVGDEPRLLLQTPSYSSGTVTHSSASGLLASDDNILVWDRGGRYRRLTFDLQDFGISSGRSVGDILRLLEDGETVHASTTSGAVINFANPNQGDPIALAAGSMLAAEGAFEPQIKVSETYREELTPVPGSTGAPYSVALKGVSRFSITASLAGADAATFAADTIVSLHVGDYRFTGKLGDDPSYSIGKKRVSFPTTTILKGRGKVVGNLTWSWNRNKLQVTGNFSDPAQFGLAHHRYVGWAGAVNGWMPIEISFATLSGAQDAVWLTGKSSDTKSNYTSHRVRTVTLAGSDKTAPAW